MNIFAAHRVAERYRELMCQGRSVVKSQFVKIAETVIT